MESNLIKCSQWPFKSILNMSPIALIKIPQHGKRAHFGFHFPRGPVHKGIEDKMACRLGMTAPRRFLFSLGPQSRGREGTGNGHRLQSLRTSPKDPILSMRLDLLSFQNIPTWHYQPRPIVQILNMVGDVSYLNHNRRLFK